MENFSTPLHGLQNLRPQGTPGKNTRNRSNILQPDHKIFFFMLRTSHDNITTSLLKVQEKLQPQHRRIKDSDMEKYI